jgi:hypothetical protein
VVVVSAYAVYALAAAEHIVVNSGIVIVISAAYTRAVEHFKGVHSVEIHIVSVVLKRPRGVIVGYEEACLAAQLHVLRAALTGVLAHVVGLTLIKFHTASVLDRVGKKIVFSVPAGLNYRVGIESDTAKMTGLDYVKVVGSLVAGLVGLGLKAVECEEVIVAKLGVRNKNIVIRIGYYRISLVKIYLLYLLGRTFSVRKSSVTVKICLVEIFALRKKNFFHIELLVEKNIVVFIITP